MKEIEYGEPVSDMAKSFQGQAQDVMRAHLAGPVVVAAPAPARREPMTMTKAFAALADLLKANVKGFTKKDGTVVSSYTNKVQKHAGPLTAHPNYHPDDHQALKEKGYNDGEISAIFDQDTANNGGQPTGGNPRKDLKLPTKDQPDGQPGPAAKAAAGKKPKGGGASLADEAAGAGAPSPKDLMAAGKAKPQPSAAGKATGATHEQLDQMESSLANDEDSTDEELVAFFVKEGIPEAVAKQAVTHRDAFTMGVPKKGLLAELMEKDAAGKGGSADAGGPPALGSAEEAAHFAAKGVKPGAAPKGKPAAAAGGKPPALGSPEEAAHFAGQSKPGAGVPRETGDGGDAPPHADSNIDNWDKLPEDENPQYAMQGMGSKDLGRLATMKPEHAKAYAHKELANRGQDSDGNWMGFDKANAHHAANIPSDFQPDDIEGPNDGGITGGMQMVHGKVLSAAAKGHVNLQDRARAHLAARGHDTNGNWKGFEAANQLHGFDGKTGKPLAKKPGGGGAGGGSAKQQADLFKALRPGERPMFFVSAEGAAELQAMIEKAGGVK